jgi:hypothetical protein
MQKKKGVAGHASAAGITGWCRSLAQIGGLRQAGTS